MPLAPAIFANSRHATSASEPKATTASTEPDNQCRKPAVSIIGYGRIIEVVAGAVLIVDAVEEGVEHDIAAVDTQLCQKPLYSVTGHTDQDASHYVLVLGGVLTNTQYSCASIQSAAIKDRPPLNPKRIGGKDRPVWGLVTERCQGFLANAGIECRRHCRPLAVQLHEPSFGDAGRDPHNRALSRFGFRGSSSSGRQTMGDSETLSEALGSELRV